MALSTLALSAAWTAQAQAQVTPAAPANGAQVTESEVVLTWVLASGWSAGCVQWSARPETAYPGGPFLDPDGSDCSLAPQAVAWLMRDLGVRRYYWHVQARRAAPPYDDVYGPTAYFDSVEPPRPRGCSTQAAKVMAEEVLYPALVERHPSFYDDNPFDTWHVGRPICRDLTGDGDREMIVQLPGGTGGAVSPWAIFSHDSSGAWRMVYYRGLDTVWRIKVVKRRVRATGPAPYEGACTRFTRDREVRFSDGRYRSKLLKRKRVSRGC